MRSMDLWTNSELRQALGQTFWVMARTTATAIARHDVPATVGAGITAFSVLFGVIRVITYDAVDMAIGLRGARRWDRRLERAAGAAMAVAIGGGWLLAHALH